MQALAPKIEWLNELVHSKSKSKTRAHWTIGHSVMACKVLDIWALYRLNILYQIYQSQMVAMPRKIHYINRLSNARIRFDPTILNKWRTTIRLHKDTHSYRNCTKLICTFGYNSMHRALVAVATKIETEKATQIFLFWWNLKVWSNSNILFNKSLFYLCNWIVRCARCL